MFYSSTLFYFYNIRIVSKIRIIGISYKLCIFFFSVITLNCFSFKGSENGIYIIPPNELLIPRFEARHHGLYACTAMLANQECLRLEFSISESQARRKVIGLDDESGCSSTIFIECPYLHCLPSTVATHYMY